MKHSRINKCWSILCIPFHESWQVSRSSEGPRSALESKGSPTHSTLFSSTVSSLRRNPSVFKTSSYLQSAWLWMPIRLNSPVTKARALCFKMESNSSSSNPTKNLDFITHKNAAPLNINMDQRSSGTGSASNGAPYVGRLAPTPSGLMHGNAAWLFSSFFICCRFSFTAQRLISYSLRWTASRDSSTI